MTKRIILGAKGVMPQRTSVPHSKLVRFIQFSGPERVRIVGADDGEGTPVPIPNTAVKLTRADNTWLEAARDDR